MYIFFLYFFYQFLIYSTYTLLDNNADIFVFHSWTKEKEKKKKQNKNSELKQHTSSPNDFFLSNSHPLGVLFIFFLLLIPSSLLLFIFSVCFLTCPRACLRTASTHFTHSHTPHVIAPNSLLRRTNQCKRNEWRKIFSFYPHFIYIYYFFILLTLAFINLYTMKIARR